MAQQLPLTPQPKPQVYVGVDVHKDFHRVAVIPRDVLETKGGWRKATTFQVFNTRADYATLVARIQQHTTDPTLVAIAIDHTGGHYSAPVVHFLSGQGYPLWYVHPFLLNFIKHRVYGQEDKTDHLDAKEMAWHLYQHLTGGRAERITQVAPRLGSLVALLGTLIRRRQVLVKLHTQATNRLHHLFRSTFPEGEKQCFEALCQVARHFPTPQRILDAARDSPDYFAYLPQRSRERLLALAGETIGVPGGPWEASIGSLAWLRHTHAQELEQVATQVGELLAQHPYTAILRSLPGLGQAGVATLAALVEDIARFPTVKQFRKHLGVYPTIAQSGGKAGTSVMGREGSRAARRVLWQAVMTLISPRCPPTPFRAYYERRVNEALQRHRTLPPEELKKKGLRKRAMVATMGKYVEVLYHCLVAGEPYQAPTPPSPPPAPPQDNKEVPDG